MLEPDLSGLDREYRDRWPTSRLWLVGAVSVGYGGLYLVRALEHGPAWATLVWIFFALAVGVESVMRWRRPAGVRLLSDAIIIRPRSSLLRPPRTYRYAWDDVVGVDVEPRGAFSSRLLLHSQAAVALPGMPASAALTLRRVVDERQGRLPWTDSSRLA